MKFKVRAWWFWVFIVAALRPPTKPKTVKRQTEEFMCPRLTDILVMIGTKKTSSFCPTAFKTFLMHNVKELNVLMMSNKIHRTQYLHHAAYKSIILFLHFNLKQTIFKHLFSSLSKEFHVLTPAKEIDICLSVVFTLGALKS
uniref:Uncharacterized protein n=1 Tax=Oryzias melastigma TaxID=30732 RepID=A0A3B3B5P3_ORYME